MSQVTHKFSSYVLNPIPDELWRKAEKIEGIKLGFCETCGFYHTDPYPSPEYLARFYSEYEMPTPQENLAETARLLARNIPLDAKVLDMGCGDGAFLHEMHKLGFKNLSGFDQSPGLKRAKSLEIGEFYESTVWAFLDQAEADGGTGFDAVVMVNVLEHVTEPLILLDRINNVLKSGAVLSVTVPNDFSPLQRAFLKVKGHLPWFVHMPDHLNYFDFKTLQHALTKRGFDVIDKAALYPLELFLLQDLDYIESPELGPVAHRRRVMFEDNMKAAGMTDALDHFYRALADGGYGRDAMVVARKR